MKKITFILMALLLLGACKKANDLKDKIKKALLNPVGWILGDWESELGDLGGTYTFTEDDVIESGISWKGIISHAEDNNIKVSVKEGTTDNVYEFTVSFDKDKMTNHFKKESDGKIIHTQKDSEGTRIITLVRPGEGSGGTVSTGKCGAYIAKGVWKEFMCHNLGADYSKNAFLGTKEINGNYYRWGKKKYIADASTPQDFIKGFTDEPISPNKSWNMGTEANPIKAPDDPCPTGYRIPTKKEWEGLAAWNTVDFSGVWHQPSSALDLNNYTAGLKIGSKLFLPATGMRGMDTSITFDESGFLRNRSKWGYYWTSTEGENSEYAAYGALITRSYFNTILVDTYSRSYEALACRCIKE